MHDVSVYVCPAFHPVYLKQGGLLVCNSRNHSVYVCIAMLLVLEALMVCTLAVALVQPLLNEYSSWLCDCIVY